MKFSPTRMTAIRAATSTPESSRRGGAVICSWLMMKDSTVLVMPTA
jgi:hypothetical protein